MAYFDEAELYSGFAAEMWAAYDEKGWDHAYYKAVILANGGPALDVGCGTGRLLRSYLQAGMDVDGVDISADMLAHCRRLAHAQGLREPTLYHQPMQALDIPRRYATIYVPCGSLACVMERDEVRETLRRFHRHLEPGGELVFNLFIEEEQTAGKTFPSDWVGWSKADLPDGRKLQVDRRVMKADRIDQAVTEQRRYRIYDGETLVHEETRTGGYRWYTHNEALWMLEANRFRVEKVNGDYKDEPFSEKHTGTMVIHARPV